MRVPARQPAKTDLLEQEIEAALRPDYFIPDGASWSFVEGLERLDDKIGQLVTSEPARALELYETFLAGCYEKAEELDDSSGNFGMFTARLFCGWVKARQAAAADPEETARRLVSWIDDDPYGFCSQLERDLVKVLDRRGLAAFERRVRERFDGVVEVALGSGEHQRDAAYLHRRAAEILRAILAQQRNVEAYIALCDSTGLSRADCLAVARILQARRKPADALAWVERGLVLEERPSSSFADHELGKLNRELLLELGRGDLAREAAWAEYEAQPNKYSYAELMRYVPKAEHPVWHEKAMDAAEAADLRSLIELWLETREIDRLVARLSKARDDELEGISHYTTEPVAKTLAKAHPGLAAKLYRALGMRILEARKSKYYDAALSNFEDARLCYERAGLGLQWESLVREIRAAHHRKTGFMSGFEEVVTGVGPSAKPTFLTRAKARWSTSPRS
jgi:tetratricopeptide (TPR) repeat protein